MPKPIKKRVYKKSTPEEEVRNIYEVLKEYYEGNKRFIGILFFTVIISLAIVFGLIYYIRNKTQQSFYLQYEGLKAFHRQLSNKEGQDVLKVAYEKFQQACDKKDSPYCFLYKAYTEERLGKKTEALNTLKKVAERYKTPDIRSLAYYKMYEIYLAEKKPTEAIKALDRIVSLKGEYLKDLAMYKKALILEDQGKKDEALKIYESLTKVYPDSPFSKKVSNKIKKDKKKSPEATDKGASK